jgi:ribonuclease E
MHTLRALAVVTTAAGLLTGLPLSHALACDNDRFPCPIVSDTPETTEAPAKTTSTTPARSKKAAPRQDERAAHQDEKTRPKTEREASRAPSRAKVAKPEVQEQPVDSAAAAPAPVMQPPAAEAERTDNPAPAVAAWPPAPANAGTSTPVAAAEGTPALTAGVATVDPNDVNELDLAAAAPAPAPAESSWIKYLLATLGAALAAASTVRFLFV